MNVILYSVLRLCLKIMKQKLHPIGGIYILFTVISISVISFD